MPAERASACGHGRWSYSVADVDCAPSVLAQEHGLATFAQMKRACILEALVEANWLSAGPQGAAARLGIKRTTLQSMIKRLEIARPV